jgi:hypothetical protein
LSRASIPLPYPTEISMEWIAGLILGSKPEDGNTVGWIVVTAIWYHFIVVTGSSQAHDDFSAASSRAPHFRGTVA